MKFQEFQKIIEEYPLFSTGELRLILGKKFNKTIKIQLKQWTDAKYIIKLRRSLYLLNRKDILEEMDSSYFAAKIYPPSYISLESALSYYGIIPEATNIVTSVTTRKTANFVNNLGNYSYHHIKTEVFLGFEAKKYKFISYQIAAKEKALTDYFYFNKHRIVLNDKFWDSTRINLDKNFNLNKLKYYSKLFNNKKLNNIILNFIKYARSRFY